ncbi:MAG TPA: hypothetical protein VH301_04940 [Usitatibacter sp.]|nr:hypothetical protein [Usitatibacter sp.]
MRAKPTAAMLHGEGDGHRSKVRPLAGVVSQNQSKVRRSSSMMNGEGASASGAAPQARRATNGAAAEAAAP